MECLLLMFIHCWSQCDELHTSFRPFVCTGSDHCWKKMDLLQQKQVKAFLSLPLSVAGRQAASHTPFILLNKNIAGVFQASFISHRDTPPLEATAQSNCLFC